MQDFFHQRYHGIFEKGETNCPNKEWFYLAMVASFITCFPYPKYPDPSKTGVILRTYTPLQNPGSNPSIGGSNRWSLVYRTCKKKTPIFWVSVIILCHGKLVMVQNQPQKSHFGPWNESLNCFFSYFITRWWFQPSWKILVKMEIFPR